MKGYDGQEGTAVSILSYYLSLCVEGWDRDNESEIEALIDALIDAAIAPLSAKVSELESRIDSLSSADDLE